MALRNILNQKEEVLHKKCRTVEKFDDKLGVLIDDMIETLHKSGGVGLAAPQVGILRRVVVIDLGKDGDGVIELVNPEIVKKTGSQRGIEGCLSCPDVWGYVKRPMKVTVKAQNRNGETIEIKGSEFLARAICHELDHLDGHLFTELVDEFVDPKDLEDD